MKHYLAVILAALAIVLSSALAGNSTSPPQAATKSPAAEAGYRGTFTVELTKGVNSKKLKKGDEVDAFLTGGITLPNGTKVPRASSVVGHVTDAKARSKGDTESSIGIVFDTLALSGGETLPIQAVIRAVAPNPYAALTRGTMSDAYGVNLAETTAKSSASTLDPPAIPLLNEESRGVLGISNLQLTPQGVLISTGKEVKLDSGIRMLPNVTIPGRSNTVSPNR